jgi:hypothetical protein
MSIVLLTFHNSLLRLLKQYRETGKIRTKPHGGGVQLTVTSLQLTRLAEIVEANNDATL